MLTDAQIAQSAKMEHIGDVAKRAGLNPDKIEFY